LLQGLGDLVLIHIVCFKYKADVDDRARRDHRQRLKALAVLEGVVELKVGVDVVGSPRSYDTGLMAKFRDRAALDAYQANPLHVPVAQHGVGLCDSIVSVDFDA
jgi:stress responsive alpha/beta barrel protein